MRAILDNEIPIREEFEIMYNKIVLKPLTNVMKKLKSKEIKFLKSH